jgi:hypothetical protein
VTNVVIANAVKQSIAVLQKTGSPRYARDDGGGRLLRSVRDEGGLPPCARSDERCHCERSEAIHCSVAKNWIATLRSQ